MFSDFSEFYAQNSPTDNKPKWIILANNKYKIYFDLIILATLLFTTFVVPWRLAFTDSDSIAWTSVYLIIDVIYLIDVILTFFTSYTDEFT